MIFIFFASIYFSRFLPGINQQPEGGARWIGGLVILLLAAFPSGIFALLAYFVQRYRIWPFNLFTYVLEVAIGQALLLPVSPIIALVLKNQLNLEFDAPVALNFSLFIASLGLVLGMLAIMHHAERTILDRLKSAAKLVAKLELEREGLIRADEELRQQTSSFLHDRVQSDLMIASLKLKSIAGSASAEVNEVIDRVIARLEQTRTIDIKDLVQVLAPNFEVAGFEQSVQVLAQTYRTSMNIGIWVDETSENLNKAKLLGVFRIIEQALLNALIHGPAKNVNVSFETDKEGDSRLEISDDGPGCSVEEIESGVGTAVIDSWVGILNGTKTIDTMPDHGYRLTVEFGSSKDHG
ncbi:sensor histidine kinase [Aquiluna borgnonia]|uniref:sensor histidine kinase n=1 Tax=Aquiluna borgnonia TaxID=2499157 RepID=UPI001BC9FCF8|nr:ATP-binding protein [Aquiluna borgnonia]